jgi:hypothetical protein
MGKKKKFRKQKQAQKQYRNASATRAPVPRAPRAPAAHTEETPLNRLGMTAAGAAGTSLVGSFLSHEGWAPKTIATALAAVGAGLAWKGDAPNIRSIGAGAMSAAGSQLALMLIDDRDNKSGSSKQPPLQQTAPAQPTQAAQASQRQAGELPAGALENAFERAKARLSLSSGVQDEVDQ